nr:hypothetical protein [Acidisoma sp. PAMC 29798]
MARELGVMTALGFFHGAPQNSGVSQRVGGTFRKQNAAVYALLFVTEVESLSSVLKPCSGVVSRNFYGVAVSHGTRNHGEIYARES